MQKSILSSNVIVGELPFNDDTPSNLEKENFYSDWPVVYILNNDKSVYIGETYHAKNRMEQHLKNEKKRNLKECHIFASDLFTKSATLDVESSLIELFKSENNKYVLNDNSGIVKHEYHNKNQFSQDSQFFATIWNKLTDLGLVKTDIETIKNQDLFKYSPYKSLNAEQCTVRDYVIEDILNAYKNNTKQSIVIRGSAGTGKTILALYLLKLFVTGADYINDDEESESYPFVNDIKEIIKIKGSDLKVGYVVSMSSFRSTLQSVIKEIRRKNPKFKKINILSPNDVINKDYDILIVDEAHRLKQLNALGAEIGKFYEINQQLYGDKKGGNQLDWITKFSKIQILFYDELQSIKPCDVDKSDFDKLLKSSKEYNLSSQMRCLGGNDYIEYIKDILNENDPKQKDFGSSYEFKLFENINDFTKAILEKEKEFKLSRIVSGYGFKWVSKKDNSKYDILIDNRQFKWNKTNEKWPISLSGESVAEEVGCIHTIQGYDCNYCGVIFGKEIYYEDGKIKVDRKNYYDINGKKNVDDDDDLLNYIKNIYFVLLTRGIRGTYVYACDDNLREYLKKYIDNNKQ